MNTRSFGFSGHTASRTQSALDEIDMAKKTLRLQLTTGELAAMLATEGAKSVKHSHLLRLTTLNSNFLNGKNHRTKTKRDIEGFLEQLNKDLVASAPTSAPAGPERVEYWRDLYEETSEKYERLATRAHGWKTSMQQLARENRELKKKVGVKIVPIRP
jgi:hypothetical protein